MRHGEGHSGGSAGDTVIKLVVGLAVLGVVAAIAIPNLLTVRGGHGNETAAIATLRNLASVQRDFRERRLVDIDGDGVGEFGTLCEMTGTYGVRTTADAGSRGARLKPPILSPALSGVNREGVVTKSGYAFRIFLPAAEGGAVHERGPVGVMREPSSGC